MGLQLDLSRTEAGSLLCSVRDQVPIFKAVPRKSASEEGRPFRLPMQLDLSPDRSLTPYFVRFETEPHFQSSLSEERRMKRKRCLRVYSRPRRAHRSTFQACS